VFAACVGVAGAAVVVVSADAGWLLCITSAPTEPPTRAAIKATGSNLLVKIIALLLLAKDQVLLEYDEQGCKHHSSMSGDLKKTGKFEQF
jgi:hypothetical protein